VRQAGGRYAVKRSLDVGLALTALVVLSPVLLVVALLVRQRLGAPVLFRQVRVGRDGELFTLTKFRTMRDAAGPDGERLPDEQRLTSLGQFLRSTSLDELPELWNVVRGDMSMVGPRPLLVQYLPLYSQEQSRRHDVLPGVTGWAQVNGRNTTGWAERLALDTWYVDNWTLWLDGRILFRTIGQVVRRHGISYGEHATMPLFEGTAGESP
jgi:lipopolysaccharide/colanic/teichoic acid biosynthesis glycosyltransferase